MEPTKRCPYCGELILRIAIRCKHCQADLSDGGQASMVANPLGSPAPGSSPYANPAAPAGYDPMARPVAPAGYDPMARPVAPPMAPHGAAGELPPGMPLSPLASIGSGPQGNGVPYGNPVSSGGASGPTSTGGGSLTAYVPPAEGTFEHRFLDFAFKTTLPINPATVAYALKIPIDEADEGLQDLAARDVLIRDVDPRGVVTYTLPGRSAVAAASGVQSSMSTALSPYAQPPALLYDPPGALTIPTENTALAGLLVNVCFPGLGSLIGGKTSAGVFQLLMFLLGLPLCIVVIGAPMVIGAWIWGLVTGVNMLNEAKQTQQRRTLAGG